MLTDREIARLIIIGVVIITMLFSQTVRKSLLDVLHYAFNKYILGPVLIYLAYSASLIWIAWSLGWWSYDLLKDTFVVVFITGIGMVFGAHKIKSGGALIKKTIGITLGASAFITFYVNLTSFSVISEIILQLLFGAVVIMRVFAEYQKEASKSLVKFLDSLIIIGGIALIIKTTAGFAEIWETEGPSKIFEPLVLSIMFPLMLIPFVYIFSLVIKVETLLRGLSAISKDPIRLRVIIALLLGLHMSIKYASSFSGQWRMDILEISTYSEARKLMRRYRQDVQLQENRIKAKKLRLKNYAGVEGVDEHGKQLDRREFKESQQVLTEMNSYQMGQHRNRLGHYFEDPLILVGGNEKYRLKTELDIEVKLSKNKQSWYAWRRTPSGWVFAVGGSKNIDIHWRYDGPEPPKSFPGRVKDEWSTEPGSGNASNWIDQPF